MIYTSSALKVLVYLTCLPQPRMKCSQETLEWNDPGKCFQLNLPQWKDALLSLHWVRVSVVEPGQQQEATAMGNN